MGDITTASGTKVYISTTAAASSVDTATEFAAKTYVEIGLIESVGEFGDESADVAFAAIGDGRTRHAKGARDAGTMALVCAHDPTDAGQAAIELAEQTDFNYAFRVLLADSPGGAYSNSDIYFRGLVRSRRKNVGTNDNVIRNTYNVGVNSELFVAPATSL